MINFEQELNLEQLNAVQNADGPCLVLAGAGSGKTRVITYRVAYLLEQGVKPENILLVTFTNKAAKEMIERVGVLVSGRGVLQYASTDEAVPRLYTGEFQLPWSGTFHHIGYRILKRYAELIGYKNNFSVLDSEDSLSLIKLCLKQEGIDRKERRFPSPAVLEDIISFARNSEQTIEDVLDLKHPHFLSISDFIIRIAEDYQKRKLEANVMDFDDLLVNWHLLLLRKSPLPPFNKGGEEQTTPLNSPLGKGGEDPIGSGGILAKLAGQFQYILVDEYQDTNKIQASIIDLLSSRHKNLLVVGDDAQSIYSFRAADIQNILAFEKKYKDAKIFKLETNYRSTPDILNLANNIISNNLNQYEKNLTSLQKRFTKPELHAFVGQAEEAEFIVNRLEELRGEGVEANKIAVLFRAAYHSQALEMELVKQGIDYDYRGGVRFFERAHVKDVLAYLRIINNSEDAVAWRRVLNMQVGIGPANAERIIAVIARPKAEAIPVVEEKAKGLPRPDATSGLAMTAVASQLSVKAQIGWSDFLNVWRKMNLVIEPDPTPPSPHRGGKIADLIRAVVESKYSEYLENEYPDYRERTQDIEQLSVFAKNQNDLNMFLAEATLQESFRRIDQQPPPPPFIKGGKDKMSPLYQRGNKGVIGGLEEKIILSTIHQAKGLEWEAVFVMGLSAGQFPNDRAVRENGGLEEERRLFYVAVTRAKKYLHLTYSLSGGFGDFLSGPSMFIEEIDVELVDNQSASGGTAFDEVEYVDEDEGIRNTKSTKLRNEKRSGFLKELDEL